MKLICLPFAGGDQTYYYKFTKFLNKNIEMIPIKLNGRGERFGSKLYSSFLEMQMDIESQIFLNNGEDYILFGHSMGGLLAYELYYQLFEKFGYSAKKLIISSCPPPKLVGKKGNAPNPELDNMAYMKEVIKLGGTPKEIMEHPDLVNLLVPVVRRDFDNIRDYKFLKKQERIKTHTVVIWGDEEKKLAETIGFWSQYCANNIVFKCLKGNHFYINKNIESIVNIIENV
ncbi:thioesterase II family protein [Enterococcus faecalis]